MSAQLKRSAMLTMKGSMVVCFGIDPEHVTSANRAKLVESGMSLRIVHPRGIELGPVFPAPITWLRDQARVLYFRNPLSFHNWNGWPGTYDTLALRIVPSHDMRDYIQPQGLVCRLKFQPTWFGPEATAIVALPGVKLPT